MLRNPTQESREEADSSESSLLDRKQVSPNQHDDTDLHSSASDSYSQIPRYPSQPSGNNHEEHNYSERTPLLDPDDPAVSPLNLPGVQAMRIILAVMLALTYFWTILLFINCFVSVPFMKLRTSGFLELDLCLLSLVTLFIALLFFNVPSSVELILGYIVNVCLLVQFILMWTIPYMRHSYGFIGIFITGWTLVCLVLSLIVSPRVVKWGKSHEEIRLTGRRETRRTISEWFKISFSFLLLVVFVVIPGVLFFLGFMLEVYDTTRLLHNTGAATAGTFITVPSRPGKFSHEYSVFIECTPTHKNLNPPLPPDQEAPIVLIEADDSVSAQVFYEGWVEELYNINKISKVCFWNRPGRGFSDVAPSPFSLEDSADALTAALEDILARENPISSSIDGEDEKSSLPFQNHSLALVSHGLGGLYSRAFASRHMSSIHSILLVDTLHEDILRQTIGPIAHGFMLWLDGVLSPLALERQISWLVHGRGPSYRYLSGMSGIGRSSGSSIRGSHGGLAYNTNPKEIKASLQDQMAALSGAMRNEVQDSNELLQGSNIPVAVVASAQSIRKNRDWSSLQRKLARLTANNVAFEIYDGPHEIWTARKAKEQLQDLYTHILREKRTS